MSKAGFDYSGFKAMAEGLKNAYGNHRKFIEDFLLEQALRVLAQTKRRTPSETGNLRNNWQLSGVAWRGNDCMINITNASNYASFVEYGHFQRPGRFVPGHWEGNRFVYEQGAKEGMVLKQPWVKGHYMVTIPLQELERALPQRYEAAWKAYMEGHMKGGG